MLNDYLGPFRNTPSNMDFVAEPIPGNFLWGQQNAVEHAYNAIHMSVIPKGPHQGKVMVWDRSPVLIQPNSSLAQSGGWWICQSWSIIDPDTREFLNYLLPLETVSVSNGEIETADLFCCGHCWTQDGDLIVAGGCGYKAVITNIPFTKVIGSETGARYLFSFDPAMSSQAFPGAAPNSSLYGTSHAGNWRSVSGGLLIDRWYPTVTLSQDITRADPARNPGSEVVMIAGGSDVRFGSDINDYESWVPLGNGVLSSSPLVIDPDPATLPSVRGQVLDGPITVGVTLHDEEFGEYPRLHLLSDGRIFKSGPRPLGAATDLASLTTGTPAMRSWTTPGRTWTDPAAWQMQRHDGTSLLLARFNGLDDVVVRLCGSNIFAVPGNGAVSTDTAEFCLASTGNAVWTPLPSPGSPTLAVPGGPRTWANAIVLPDGSIVVIGGADGAASTFTMTTALWRLGPGWVDIGMDSPTRRAYHATAVLLPDGRVFVGGGETGGSPPGNTERDYDIFIPHYLQGSAPRPVISAVTDSTGGSLPTHPDGTIELQRNQGQFVVECTNLDALDAVAKIVLMAPGSITHHSDMSARFVEMPSSPNPDEPHRRLFALPAAPKQDAVPRGYYMLFALNTSGTPSVAQWVKVL